VPAIGVLLPGLQLQLDDEYRASRPKGPEGHKPLADSKKLKRPAMMRSCDCVNRATIIWAMAK
jgi:hypothetical protein